MDRKELVSLIKSTAGEEIAGALTRYQEKSKDVAVQIIAPEMRAANDSQGAMDRTLRNEQRGIALSGALCILAEARGNLKDALAISASERWKNVVGVQKILEAGTGTSGGVLISPEHSQEIIDLPERLIGADADYFLRWTLNAWCKVDGAITEEALAAYLQAFQSADAIHAACEDYRAAATVDLAHDLVDERAGRRLTMPLLALWGAQGTVAREFDRASVAGEVRIGGLGEGSLLRTLSPRRSSRRDAH